MEVSGRSECHQPTYGNRTWCCITSNPPRSVSTLLLCLLTPFHCCHSQAFFCFFLLSPAVLTATSPSSTRLKSCWTTPGWSTGTLQPFSRVTARSSSCTSHSTCRTAAWSWEHGHTTACWSPSTLWVCKTGGKMRVKGCNIAPSLLYLILYFCNFRTAIGLTSVTSWSRVSGCWRTTGTGNTGSTTPAVPTHLTWTSPTTSWCSGCLCTSSSTSSFPACSSPSSLDLSSTCQRIPVRNLSWKSRQETKEKLWLQIQLKEV